MTALESIADNLRRWPIFPGAILALLVICGVFAPYMAPRDPVQASLRARNTPPVWAAKGSAKYLLGADQQGRDVLSRVIYGARVSLVVAGVALGIGGLVGTVLGMISGYFGGWVDEIVMRLIDIMLAVPLILIALVVVIVMGQSMTVLIAILAINAWSGFARQARAEVLQLKTMDYVSMAKVSGASSLRILYQHIFPGVVSTIIIVGTLQVGNLILTEAILSFLGAGIPPPMPSWGSMVSDGRTYLGSAWWIAFFPGISIFLTVLAFNFLGDWLRDHLDPRLRQS
ncbi:ABC transporter permease [Candidatus Entotheonella palauensis]|uniref:ABC transporter permease n=1 Tax=Candidatus Entotheonella palauensis TaxID=93172 RepID=UPI000B7EC551|nr:ABC transporter permease [Candidatus Entotheonella palauensis]